MNKSMDVSLCFVVALGCEAKPLLAEFEFVAAGSAGGLPLYNNGCDWLVVSGVGKVASAAATAYLAAKANPRHSVWLNVGIAGSGQAPLETWAVAHHVRDGDSGEHWYPTFVTALSVPTLELTTASTPQFDYSQPGMFDMEASGFLPTALRFASAEWVHIFKVISDTAADSARDISAKRVAQWIGAAVPTLREWSESLRAARVSLVDGALEPREVWVRQAASRWRFTVYQRHRLERLLQKWIGRDCAGGPPWERLNEISDAQTLLDRLEEELQRLPVRLGSRVR